MVHHQGHFCPRVGHLALLGEGVFTSGGRGEGAAKHPTT